MWLLGDAQVNAHVIRSWRGQDYQRRKQEGKNWHFGPGDQGFIEETTLPNLAVHQNCCCLLGDHKQPQEKAALVWASGKSACGHRSKPDFGNTTAFVSCTWSCPKSAFGSFASKCSPKRHSVGTMNGQEAAASAIVSASTCALKSDCS